MYKEMVDELQMRNRALAEYTQLLVALAESSQTNARPKKHGITLIADAAGDVKKNYDIQGLSGQHQTQDGKVSGRLP
jgi:phage regulator Rha-like protein